MAYQRKTASKAVTDIKPRLDAMTTIDAAKGKEINYGGEDRPVTGTTVRAQIALIADRTSKYNGALDLADALNNEIEAAEKTLADMGTAVLRGGKNLFGDDSNEVEQLGGTRRSERGKPKAKAKPGV